jgi:hypothetical protein
MANDQNKSNKGPMNSLGDSGFSDIENIGRRAGRHTAEDIAQRVRVSQARSNITTYEAGLQAGPSDEIASLIGRHLANERKTVNSLEPRIELRAETQRQRFTNLTQSVIERNFASSSVNGQASEFARSSTGQRLSLSMMNTPYDDLEARRNASMNQIGMLGQKASGIAEQLYNERGQQDPAKLQQIQQIYGQRNRMVNMVGGIDAALRHQRAQGLDPQSRQDTLFNAGQRAQDTLFRAGVSQELASGTGDLGGKSAGELKQKEIQLAGQLVEALEKLKNSANASAEEVDKMKEAASKTAEDLEKVKEAVAQGGGSGGDKYTNAGNALAFAQGAFGAVGSGIQQIGVNQRLGQVSNISGYASIENQKYQTYKAASAGDVASQLQLGQFGEAEAFGRQLRNAANTAVGAQVAGGVAQTAAGGVRIASTLNPVENAMSTSQAMGQRLQGAGEVVQGLVNTAVSGSDLARDVSGSNAAISGVNAQMEARRQLSMVSATQLQGFRDFGVGISTAAIGMGRQGAGFTDRMISKDNMESMVNSRISPEQMAQMAQMGVQQIGSTFNESQIFSARGLERSGFGTMGENMQRMSTLASAGANNPQAGLSSVLEAAFGKSLDGSKVLNMMVENTGTMVQQSAGRAMGLDTTAASAQILAAGVNTADPNQEHAMQRAMTAAQRMAEIGTDTGVNFAAMSATSRISKMTGAGGDEAIILQQLDDQTLRTMKQMKPNELKSKFRDIGVGVEEGKEGDMVNNLIKARLVTNLQAGGAGLAQGINASQLADSLVSGKRLQDLPNNEQLAIGRAARLGGFGGAEEFIRSATAINSAEPTAATKSTVADNIAGKGGSDQQKMLDDMRTQGFKQLSQAALEATTNFKTAGEALKALGQLAKQVENIGDTGGEGKFKTAASDAAGSFGKSTMKFEKSVDDFSKAIGRLNSKSGLSGADDSDGLIDKLKADSSKVSAPR